MTAEDFSVVLQGVVLQGGVLQGVVLQGVVLQGLAGVCLILGVTPCDHDPVITPANHSLLHGVDEAAMPTGIKALSALALDARLHGVPTLRPVT